MTTVTPSVTPTAHPRFVAHARLHWDTVRATHLVLTPEGVLVLNPTGAAILQLCDGERSLADIAATLGARYGHAVDDDVHAFVERLIARRVLELGHANN